MILSCQTEEPFSILPIEAFCDGAIAATMDEMNHADETNAFDFDDEYAQNDIDAVEKLESQGEVAPTRPVRKRDALSNALGLKK